MYQLVKACADNHSFTMRRCTLFEAAMASVVVCTIQALPVIKQKPIHLSEFSLITD